MQNEGIIKWKNEVSIEFVTLSTENVSTQSDDAIIGLGR
jgi:hypothetical protein